jgi:glycosyltransferase involved in cell wall biosynthesis
MPMYNAGRFLAPAIESILQQTFRDFELLIVNDASTDGSMEIARSFADRRIRIVDNEMNLGLARTLNRGLQLATGEFIARHDADDLSHHERLEKQVEFLRAHPDVALVGTQAIIIDEWGKYKRILLDQPHEHVAIKWDLLFDNSFVHTSVMFRRVIVVDKFSGYDPSYVACEDYELWSRLADVCEVANLPSHLVFHRLHFHSKRQGTEECIKIRDVARVIQRNADRMFGEEFLSTEDSALLAEFSFGYRDRVSLIRFLQLFDRLMRAYVERYPEAAHSLDFKATVRAMNFKLFYDAWKNRVMPPAFCFLRRPAWIMTAGSLLVAHLIRSRQRLPTVSIREVCP